MDGIPHSSLETSSELNCLICNEPLGSDTTLQHTVKEKGINKMRTICYELGDEALRRKLYDITKSSNIEVTFHKKCHDDYVYKKKRVVTSNKSSPSTSSRVLRSSDGNEKAAILNLDNFDLCIFCRIDCASENFRKTQTKLPEAKRTVVNTVESVDTIDKIKGLAESRTDEIANVATEVLSQDESEQLIGKLNYHKTCYVNFKRESNKSEEKPNGHVSKVVDYIFHFVEERPETTQFSLKDLILQFQNKYPEDRISSTQWIKKQLEKLFNKDIFIASNKNQETIICRRQASNKILIQHFQSQNFENEQDIREHKIKEAAKIILEDIENKDYSNQNYPAADKFFESLEEFVPQSLFQLLWTILTAKKKKKHEMYRKVLALGHSIITSVKPIKVQSPLQLGVAVTLYHRFGSKNLLDILSSLGACSTYYQVLLFQASAIHSQPEPKLDKCFAQYVFDNADHNVNTIDGHNTFHYMGGIQISVPHTAIKHQSVPKLPKLPKSETFSEQGIVKVRNFHADPKKDIGNIVFEKFEVYSNEKQFIKNIKLSDTDFLWLYTKYADLSESTGWNNFMEELTSGQEFQKSRITCLPFISAPPSDIDTIYTSLMQAHRKAKTLNLPYIYVTFDLPLYIKAVEIIFSSANDHLKNIIPILGGFHLIMSYLGSIGNIMDGSGLKEILCFIYAENSVKHILSGHAYARAVRAHVLIHAALSSIIFSMINLTKEEKECIDDLKKKKGDKNIFNELKNSEYQSILQKFNDKLNELEIDEKPTSKLWVQYFRMVTLLKNIIESARCSNWNAYLQCIIQMLPIFHASGHNLYAKCAHIFVQQMLKLNMTQHKDFIKNFSVRRTDKFYCGIYTDQTIETSLMKVFKDPTGGLTHGRGTDDTDIAKWILSLPIFIDIFESCQDFCKVSVFGTSDQHKCDKHDDGGSARKKKDKKDLKKLIEWFQEHSPFNDNDKLMSLSSGVIGDVKVNCQKAFESGIQGIQSISAKKLSDVVVGRKYRVKPLSIMHSSMKLYGKSVVIDPTLLFQRISLIKKSDKQLQNFFEYELAPYPLSLFDENGMRKNVKSTLYEIFSPLSGKPQLSNPFFVIDGGYFLHKVTWEKDATYFELFMSYINYLKNNFTKTMDCCIIFDGYSTDSNSTKNSERLRRLHNSFSTKVDIQDIHTVPPLSQKMFLLHSENKQQFISLLCNEFKTRNIQHKICKEDADADIIRFAVAKKNNNSQSDIVIVGQDIDLLVLLTHFASSITENIYFYKPKIGKTREKYYSQHSFKKLFLKKNILFLHAFSGCDTTSAFAGIGKKKICLTLEKYKFLQKDVDAFYDPEATETMLFSAARGCIEGLYGSKPNKKTTLEKLRYICFNKYTTKTACKLTALPPTTEAANQHSLRVYHQIQKWLFPDNQKSACKYGWHMTSNGLLPVTLPKSVKPLPDLLLNSIACSCKAGENKCKTRACSCKKIGLKCTVACKYCEGVSCLNCEEEDLETEREEILDEMNEEFETISESENSSVTESETDTDIEDSFSEASSESFTDSSLDQDYDRDENDAFYNYPSSDTETQTDDSCSSAAKRRRVL